MKNIAHIESWWSKDGHFNMNHYLNVIREKNERVYHHLSNQGKDMDNQKETCQSIRQSTCQGEIQSLERFNNNN